MKTFEVRVLSVSLLLCATMSFMPSAHAASKLAKACKKDLQKAGCTANTDKEIHECLEKYEDRTKANEGLSKACFTAHKEYEKASGKMGTPESGSMGY